MLEEIKKIVYKEGYAAHDDGVYPFNNPYEGVSDKLAVIWYDAWWDCFYKDDE